MPNASETNASEPRRARRVTVDRSGGPLLIEGPVEIVTEDGTTVRSDRFMAAVCTCRRSRAYPWCDTSHRARKKPAAADRDRPAGRRQHPQTEENHDGDRP